MNGAESLVRTLLASGIDTCFANPGTSEMHFVAALDQIPGLRCVLGLQENVVTGMADGYCRMAEKPAATLLHCGPGLANGLANLHNARRARSAIVNIVGDQATYHRPHDAPLTADTDALARTVSAWTRTTAEAGDVGRDAAIAVQAARAHPGQIATLILPSDASWSAGGRVGEALGAPAPAPLDPGAVETAARLLRNGGRTLLLLAGSAALAPGQGLAHRLARASGAGVMFDFVNARMARGRGRLAAARVPYAMSEAIAALAPFDTILLVGAKPPVGFFAYPGLPSVQYAPTARLHVLSRPEQDGVAALQALVDVIGAPEAPFEASGPAPEPARGAVTPEAFAQTLAALMPEEAIVSDESITFGRALLGATHVAAPHDWLQLTGGAIGDGLPVATGAAIGAGAARRVVSLQADGSAMYSLQSLWTQARENLPCTTIVFSNRRYEILIGEYRAVGATPGPTAMDMLDLGRPDLDWVKLAGGMGVEGARAETMEACADLMRHSFARPGPFLIELAI
ncbi:acetolactate synthase large subunit [Aurantimonas sp. Leaf443]|uniref:acetolactate synthase large subunit n=1 Tax=Aurantimonas sp. Leaf443 TaxID=1736378 RepID=UPI0006FA634E|nr:acetolactate synthase large subunit [Aurantimonas sp. Leaf443]KQT83984.1 hypothetical protein ASG48_11415 [Aurantimonas sp. Leaf443]